MIADSTTATPRFIEAQPDWSKPVQVVATYRTSIAEARGEGRQRARWRQQPRYAISYQVTALTVAEFAARRATILGELAAPVVVPIWTDEHELSGMAGHVATLTASVVKKKFKAGSYAYFVQTGLVSTFRRIVSISGSTVTFAAATVPSFTAGATVYPCILGKRPKDGAGFTLHLVDNSDEAISIEEL